MPLDEIDESTTVQFIRGSHRWDKLFRPRYFATETNYVVQQGNHEPLDSYEDVPVDEINDGRWEILKWAVKVANISFFFV